MEELDLFEGKKETYQIHVNEYSLPMDKLLELINNAEIPIRDVFVGDVTNQYLEYVRTLDAVDFDKAIYFVSYATRILDLKVRSLLPQTEEEYMALEEEKQSFIDELEMRRIFLDAMNMLHVRETLNVFGIEPEYTHKDYNVVIADEEFNMDALLDAFAHIMHRIGVDAPETKKNTKVIVKDRFTVVDKTKELIVLLKEKRSLHFEELFTVAEGEPEYTMGEKINTFLALLELLRRQFATVEQEEEFGAITIGIREGADQITYEDIVGGEAYLYDEDESAKAKKGNK
ncbi:MAG: segregation/condensation protein A [Clostridia bacterium]|nr:segregation/condensation protein A [Clostridia bacterium]